LGGWKYSIRGLSSHEMEGVLSMTTIEIDRLLPQERLDLIERLWNSLDGVDLRLPPALKAELERRLQTLDDDMGQGREAGEVLAELRHRHR
jgi:putative addiction module component (TIGR02574 family)